MSLLFPPIVTGAATTEANTRQNDKLKTVLFYYLLIHILVLLYAMQYSWGQITKKIL